MRHWGGECLVEDRAGEGVSPGREAMAGGASVSPASDSRKPFADRALPAVRSANTPRSPGFRPHPATRCVIDAPPTRPETRIGAKQVLIYGAPRGSPLATRPHLPSRFPITHHPAPITHYPSRPPTAVCPARLTHSARPPSFKADNEVGARLLTLRPPFAGGVQGSRNSDSRTVRGHAVRGLRRFPESVAFGAPEPERHSHSRKTA